MNYIVLLHNNIRVQITASEATQIATALTKGAKVFHLERTQEFIPLRPAPGILRQETVENTDLRKRGEYRCGAGNAHKWGESCTCFHKLPTVYELYPELAAPKSIPRLSYEEELAARAEGGERRAFGILKNQRKQTASMNS